MNPELKQGARTLSKRRGMKWFVAAFAVVTLAIVFIAFGEKGQAGATPAAPTNLVVTASSNLQMELTWTDNATNETSYTVQRSTNGTTWRALKEGLPANTISYLDSGDKASTEYYYRIKAVGKGGSSDYSNVASATTLPSSPPPPPPTPSCPSGSEDVTQDASYPIEPDDGAADNFNLQNQIDAAPSGATLCFPAGTYDLEDKVELRGTIDGLTLQGLSGSVLKRSTSSAWEDMFWMVRSQNVRFTGLTFDGGAAGSTWTQFGAAVDVYSAQNVDFDHNAFENIMGDGLMLSASPDDTSYACSAGSDITDNTFTGQNASRNAVSVICGSDHNILRNTITRWSRSDMPGGIDLEPDVPEMSIHNVIVAENLIDNTDSTVQMWNGISSALNQHGSRSSNVVISHNEVKGAIENGLYIGPTPPDSWLVHNNYVHDLTEGIAGLYNYSSRNTYQNNTVSNINGGSGYCIWYYSGSAILRGNTFTSCIYSGRNKDPWTTRFPAEDDPAPASE
jgi:hypothetical protein